jgi:hypothetical protein
MSEAKEAEAEEAVDFARGSSWPVRGVDGAGDGVLISSK